MTEEIKSTKKPTGSGALLLATALAVIGACAMGVGLAIQSLFRPRFQGNFNGNFNATRAFNSTRTFNGQFAAQRMGFGYASWLNTLGFACLVATAVILLVLLFQSRAGKGK